MAYHQFNLSVIGDPTRLAILQALASHPLPVNELAREFPMSRPAISQHLRVLNDAGLVTAQKRGAQRVYAVNTQGLAALKAHFDQFWDAVLVDLKRVAESDPPYPRKERKHARKDNPRRRSS